MKTTSYEISKKLKEAGFEAETDFYWYCYDKGLAMRHIADADGKGNVKAYDFETILDALPIKIGGYGYFSIGCRKNSPFMPFSVGYNLESDKCYDTEIFIDKIKNESLADTAGRLWLLLKEKGLIC